MDDQEFARLADQALQDLYRALANADLDADLNAGALTIEFDEPPGKFVVSPNSPVRQIWVSAHSKSYKLDWNTGLGQFTMPSGQTLRQLIEEAITRQTGEPITL
jgi:CyaY protein